MGTVTLVPAHLLPFSGIESEADYIIIMSCNLLPQYGLQFPCYCGGINLRLLHRCYGEGSPCRDQFAMRHICVC